MNTPEIVNEIIRNEGLNPKQFADSIGITPTQVYDLQKGRTKKISEDIAGKIISVYSNYSKVWLLTGEGDKYNISVDKVDESIENSISSLMEPHESYYPPGPAPQMIDMSPQAILKLLETNSKLAETNNVLAEANRIIAEANKALAESNKMLAESNKALSDVNNKLITITRFYQEPESEKGLESDSPTTAGGGYKQKAG